MFLIKAIKNHVFENNVILLEDYQNGKNLCVGKTDFYIDLKILNDREECTALPASAKTAHVA